MPWTAARWAALRYDTAAMAEILTAAGYSVTGFANQKPEINGDVDWTYVETLAEALASGKTMPTKPDHSTPRRKRHSRHQKKMTNQ